MTKIKRLSREELLANLDSKISAGRADYLAMYSTWLGGITTDPNFMFTPIDDHIVHRGDGVFEAVKCIGGKVYALKPHLERLEKSSAAIELTLPFSLNQIHDICLSTLECAMEVANSRSPASSAAKGSELGASNREGVGPATAMDFMLRLYISRGPGGFTTNPYESIGAQMYLVITRFKAMPDQKYQSGVRAGLSQFGVKEGKFSQIKSCNYLANVLMKKEAVDRKLDFTVSVDDSGFVAESSTENFAIISKDDEFIIPSFDRTLRGITAVRVMELGRPLVKQGKLKAIKNGNIRLEDIQNAKEAMMLGTTLDVLPVVEFEGQPIGDGRPGINSLNLLELLRHDIVQGSF